MARRLPKRPGGSGAPRARPKPAPKPPKSDSGGGDGPGGPKPPRRGKAPGRARRSSPRLSVPSLPWRAIVLTVGGVVALATLVIGTVGGYAYYQLRRSLPVVDGLVTVDGLSAAVDVNRDPRGVPHLSGTDLGDLARAMGFVHAQDRLFQMELSRRLGAGRLAELFGPIAVDQDRLARRLGLARAARAELERMAPASRALLEAYAGGVEAYRTEHQDALGPEFRLLSHEMEPWRPEDSLVIGKWMSYLLSSNARVELLRSELVDAVGLRSAYLLTGLDPPDDEELAAIASRLPASAGLLPEGRPMPPGASNAWVVSGQRSATGRPLLASDPHLSLSLPDLFYVIHLQGDGLDVAGASVPGVPLVLIGQNRRIAWGVTASFADVQDLYLETTNPADPTLYAWNDEWASVDVVPETIRVQGAPDVVEDVRQTRHGTVIGTADDGRLLVQRWDAIWRGDHIGALLALNRAGSWEEFTAALAGWAAPALAFVYGDVEGNIGFFPAGEVPVRVGFDGALPVDGRDDASEWQGVIPHELKPRIFNPEDGLIVSANHHVLPADTPYPLGVDALADFRGRRIDELLRTSPPLALRDFERVQQDRYDSSTEALLGHVLRVQPADELELDAMDALRGWDGRMSAGPAPLIYAAVHLELLGRTFRDELGEARFGAFVEFLEAGRPGGLHAVLEDPESPFWDDAGTPEVETRDGVIAASVRAALLGLAAEHGADVAAWDWAMEHAARFDHPLGSDGRIGWLLNRGPTPFGGSTHTIANARVSLREPFATTSGTSFRFLADLSSLAGSRAVVPSGASGHPLSPHYFDQNPAWLAGESFPLLDPRAESRLILRP